MLLQRAQAGQTWPRAWRDQHSYLWQSSVFPETSVLRVPVCQGTDAPTPYSAASVACSPNPSGLLVPAPEAEADQGSQFAGWAWITTRTAAGIRVSMDGLGRYTDTLFPERHWRSLKQAAVSVVKTLTDSQARRVIKARMAFYNTAPHSALDRMIADDAYRDGVEQAKAA